MRGSDLWFRLLCTGLIMALLSIHIPAESVQAEGTVSTLSAGPTVLKVESEVEMTVVLLSDGTVWAWGQNFAGQLGNGEVSDIPRRYPEKVEIDGNPFIVDIAAGYGFVLALDSEHNVWQWGCVRSLSRSDTCDPVLAISTPQLVMVDNAPLKAAEINAGGALAMARTPEGEIWTWGAVDRAGWGLQSEGADWDDADLTPRKVMVEENQPLTGVIQISGGEEHALALTEDRTVYVWGINTNRSLGVGEDYSYDYRLSYAAPLELPISPGEAAETIVTSSASLSSIVVTNEGKVYGWSSAGRYLGLGSNNLIPSPTRIEFLDGLSAITMGGQIVVGLTYEGKAVKTSSDIDKYGIEVHEPDLSGIQKMFAGPGDRIYLLDESGTVWTTGRNDYSGARQAFNLLGNGTMGDHASTRHASYREPMLPFDPDLPPPAVKEAEAVQYSGGQISLFWQNIKGRYDQVKLELFDQSAELLGTYELSRLDDLFFGRRWFDLPVSLDPGNYRADLYTYDTLRGSKSEIVTVHFEVRMNEYTLYLYGAPASFEFAVANSSQQSVNLIPVIQEDTYTVYKFEGYPYDYFNLMSITQGYSLSTDVINGETGAVFEVWVTPDDEPSQLEFTGGLYDGKLYVNLSWSDPKVGSDSIQFYRLYFTNTDGDKIGEVIYSVEPAYWNMAEIYGVDVPDGSVYLQLFIVDDEGNEKPANRKLWLGNLQFPSSVSMHDTNPAVDKIAPVVTFSRVANESDIAFYKITRGSFNSGILALVPASNQQSYTVALPELVIDPFESLVIHVVDKEGRTSLALRHLPIVDNMTGQIGMIDYTHRYDIEPDEIPDPFEFSFHDEDPLPGQRTGYARWSQPVEWVIAYDLYYANENGVIIGGLVRIQPDDEQEVVQYQISNVPAQAAYLKVVTIGEVYTEFDYYDFAYDNTPFMIRLDDWFGGGLVQQVKFGRLEGDVYTYVPKGTTVNDLLNDCFVFVEGTMAKVFNANDDELAGNQMIEPHSTLRLSHGTEEQVIKLRLLSELLRSEDSRTILFPDIASFVIQQLKAAQPIDITGDDRFDQQDVRLLLGELES